MSFDVIYYITSLVVSQVIQLFAMLWCKRTIPILPREARGYQPKMTTWDCILDSQAKMVPFGAVGKKLLCITYMRRCIHIMRAPYYSGHLLADTSY